MKRHDVINRIIQSKGYKSYLEIGLDEGSHLNDQKIICEHKESVDPAKNSRATFNVTSDEFFANNERERTYDLIFIDGLHEAGQVIRDIDNAFDCLNEGGTVVLHDCNPTSERMQAVPRIQGEWTGDVWKAFVSFRRLPGLSMFVVDTDYGCGVMHKGKQKPITIDNPTYPGFEVNKKDWLKLISVDQFKEKYPIPTISKDSYILSVCIPTFEQYGHGVKNLTALLNSLRTQKGSFEVVISDNSKDHNIQNLTKKYTDLNIKYVRNEIMGISANTNRAIKEASCDKIKIMYMDDILLEPDTLITFAKHLDRSNWVMSESYAINADGEKYKKCVPTYTDNIIQGKPNTIGMPSLIGFIRCDVEFDPTLKTLLDCEFYHLLNKKYGKPAVIKRALIGQRYHNNSTSRRQVNKATSEYEYLKKKHGLI